MSTAVRRFYLIAAWTPISIPTFVWLGFALRGDGQYSGFGADLGHFLITSLIFGGVPYTLVAGWATWRIHTRFTVEGQVRKLMLVLPLITAVVTALAVAAVFSFLESFLSGALMGGICALYVIVLGYFYVAATLIVRSLLSGLDLGEQSLPQSQ